MVSNAERDADTPVNSRAATTPHQSETQETGSGGTPGVPPRPSVTDLAVIRAKRFRATAEAIRDAIGEGESDSDSGRVKELSPAEAAERGCLGTLKSLHRRGHLDEMRKKSHVKGLCMIAASGGQLEVLQWLRSNDYPWDAMTCVAAASGGHFKVLRWARANGCLWDEFTCAYAAKHGHFEMLQWARANGCPWDVGTCEWAAMGGQLEVLQWARATGCP